MRLRRARTRTRRLPETLPLACHDAVLGAPRATWENTRVERRSTRVREEASGTGSGALVLANSVWLMCSGASADNDFCGRTWHAFPETLGWKKMFAIVVASGHGCRHHHCHNHRYQHQVAAAILVVIIAIIATPLLVVLFICGGPVYFWGGPV